MICLCCGKEIVNPTAEETKSGWHSLCANTFFGNPFVPELEITDEFIEKWISDTVDKKLTVPGVQKKLSVHLSKDNPKKLTIVDAPTGYILKPPSPEYAALPEAEHTVMTIADQIGIKTVPHALIKLRSDGELAYITKRIDRRDDSIYAMEDFCQLSRRQTQDKYKGSYEQCAKIIQKYSSRRGLDLSEFYIRLLFCYITGNSDMHLKNFSLIETSPGSRNYSLSEAYDLLPVKIILPQDNEEMPLTLCGKKRNISKNDFVEFAERCGISTSAAKKIIINLVKKKNKMIDVCQTSLMPKHMKGDLVAYIGEKCLLL